MTSEMRQGQAEDDIDMAKVWNAVRGSPADLRDKGLTVAVHNDYRLSGKAMTFWLMTWETDSYDDLGEKITRSFKGEGETDAEALDKIRAKFAAATDSHHHAPMCPANHYHGMRAPTGKCTCGAVKMGVFMRSGRRKSSGGVGLPTSPSPRGEDAAPDPSRNR